MYFEQYITSIGFTILELEVKKGYDPASMKYKTMLEIEPYYNLTKLMMLNLRIRKA